MHENDSKIIYFTSDSNKNIRIKNKIILLSDFLDLFEIYVTWIPRKQIVYC